MTTDKRLETLERQVDTLQSESLINAAAKQEMKDTKVAVSAQFSNIHHSLIEVKESIKENTETLKTNRKETKEELKGLSDRIDEHYMTKPEVELMVDKKINHKIGWVAGILLILTQIMNEIMTSLGIR